MSSLAFAGLVSCAALAAGPSGEALPHHVEARPHAAAASDTGDQPDPGDGHLRAFLGGSAQLSVGSVDVGLGFSGAGFGLAFDAGAQVDSRWAVYLAVRATSVVFVSAATAMLMVELSPTEQLSIATGAGGTAVHWVGIEVDGRDLFGLAIPLRLSWDFVEPGPTRRVGLRLSLEVGVVPVGTASGNRQCLSCAFEVPQVWASFLVGAVWR